MNLARDPIKKEMPLFKRSLVKSGLPKRLYHILRNEFTSQSMFSDAAFTLCNCCYLSVKFSWNIFDSQTAEIVLETLLKIIENSDFNILAAIPLIRCLGFLSYYDEMCHYISRHNKFPKIVQAIAKENSCLPLKKEMLWILSNITASEENLVPDIYLPLVIDSLGPFLRMQDSATLMVLHYLFCVVSKDASVISRIKRHDIFPCIKYLVTSELSDVSQASKQFFELTQNSLQ